jgi:hypothetical protein
VGIAVIAAGAFAIRAYAGHAHEGRPRP